MNDTELKIIYLKMMRASTRLAKDAIVYIKMGLLQDADEAEHHARELREQADCLEREIRTLDAVTERGQPWSRSPRE
jgi:chaperonin cofactor prefoldin